MAKKIETIKKDRSQFDMVFNSKTISVTSARSLAWPTIEGLQQYCVAGTTESPYRAGTLRTAMYDIGIRMAEQIIKQLGENTLKVVKGVLQTADGETKIDIGSAPWTIEKAVELGVLPKEALENRPERKTGTGKSNRKKIADRIAKLETRIAALLENKTALQAEYDALPAEEEVVAEPVVESKKPATRKATTRKSKTGTSKRSQKKIAAAA